MFYTKFIFIVNSMFQVFLALQIIIDKSGNTEKYFLTETQTHVTALFLIVCNLYLLLSERIKLNTKVKFYSSILLSSIWFGMFFQAIFNDHYRFLTPLLLLVMLIELVRSKSVLNE